MKNYDVVVIGSGVGGAAAAYALNDGGKKVALIEEGLWGGTCPNRGCDPKKILLSGVEVVERNNQLVGKGFSPIDKIKWPELMAFKHTFTDPFPRSFKEKAQSSGIDTIEGSAHFANGNQVEVDGELIQAEVFIIATGQRPSVLDIKGKEHLQTSNDFLEMKELPESIAFLGAGSIAFELAAIACAAGSKVTVIHHNDHPLKAFDSDLVSEMVYVFKERGIEFVFDVDVSEIVKTDSRYVLKAENYTHETDCVISATGRIPNTESLALDHAHVEFDKRGIHVDGYLHTTNASIYACGDVIAKTEPKLTPVASFEGAYLARHILGTSAGEIEYPPIVSVVYGSPKLGKVGVQAHEAARHPDTYRVEYIDMTSWFTYRRLHEPVSKAKLVYTNDDRLVGACVLNSQADELINYLAMAIDRGITHHDIDRMILGSPTIASDLPYLI